MKYKNSESGASAAPGRDDKTGQGLRLRFFNLLMIAVAVLVSAVLLVTASRTMTTYSTLREDMDHYFLAQEAVTLLEKASDDLTHSVQRYTVTGDWVHAEAFLEEIRVTRRRDLAVDVLRSVTTDASALTELEQALQASNDLTRTEYHAMALTLSAQEVQPEEIPEEIAAASLTEEELALSPGERMERARELVFGDAYYAAKQTIWQRVAASADRLADAMGRRQDSSATRMESALRRQQWLTVILMVIVIASVAATFLLAIRPLRRAVEEIRRDERVTVKGAHELRYLARSFNELRERVRTNTDQLTYEATHDPLTGAGNRKLYEATMADSAGKDMGFIIVDIDDFKGFNDRYGHAVGDQVLRRVVRVLQRHFRSEDLVCRIGGDEFTVLMLGATERLSELVMNKMAGVADDLRVPEGECPAVTLSVGIAFSDRPTPTGTLFEDADRALYRVKEMGRNGRRVYGEADAHLPMTEITD